MSENSKDMAAPKKGAVIVNPQVDILKSNPPVGQYDSTEQRLERMQHHQRLIDTAAKRFRTLEVVHTHDGRKEPGDYLEVWMLGSMPNAIILEQRGLIHIADIRTIRKRVEATTAEYLWSKAVTTNEGVVDANTKADPSQLTRPPRPGRNPVTGEHSVWSGVSEEQANEIFQQHIASGLVVRNSAYRPGLKPSTRKASKS